MSDLPPREPDWADQFNKDWPNTFKEKVLFSDQSQMSEFRLSLEWQVWQGVTSHYLFVNMQGSAFKPCRDSKMIFDSNYARGFFTESVQVEMKLLNVPEGNDVFIVKDSPATTAVSGSDSVSSSISFNVDGGFFSKEGTGNAGLGASIGRSFSESLEDFEIINETEKSVMRHKYRLAMLRPGIPYEKIEDMALSLGKGVEKGLTKLPPRAVSNLPIISQALFKVEGPQNQKKETLQVSVKVKVGMYFCSVAEIGMWFSPAELAAVKAALKSTNWLMKILGRVTPEPGAKEEDADKTFEVPIYLS